MTKILRTRIEASGGGINHGVRYVLGFSVMLAIVGMIVVMLYR
jgi:hypothetical protein